MKKSTKVVIALFLFFGIIFAGAAISIALLAGDGDDAIAESSWLHLELSGDIAERPVEDPLLRAWQSTGPSLLELSRALDRAAEDDRVEGVILQPSGLAIGYARAEELRTALARFRESGKPVVCWAEQMMNKDYFVATACDEIYMAPQGYAFINGLHISVTFLKGVLDNLGVEAEFTRLGAYKTAVETYTRTSMSEPSREQMDALADSLYDDLVAAIAEARDLEDAAVRGIIDEPPLTALDAEERGLIDGRLYWDELETQLAGEDELETLTPLRYLEGAPLPTGRHEVALLYAVGQIMSGASDGNSVGSDTLVDALRTVRESDRYEALILRIDSPGGSGLASDQIWHELELVQEAGIPVIASMGDTAASGGYYIAMGADAIVAQPGTITGSIGVFAGKFNFAGLAGNVGLTSESIQRGDQAEMFGMLHALDDAERETLARSVEQFYDTFVTNAAEGRGVEWDAIDAVARGRVWTGEDALGVGLVDELGGLDVAVRLAREHANIAEDESVRLTVLPRQPTFFEMLRDGGPGAVEVLAEPAQAGLLAELPLWFRLLPADLQASVEFLAAADEARTGAPLVLLPFALQID